ncbi:MAG TPA: HAMP domain-containing sensor histidine kinase [Casimicrobiaceae bacterium]|nr:HAMP domain-containing sensor histidine kinase [Casimicrobiaceae bacterium]
MNDIDLAKLVREELERWADAAVERDIDLGYDGPDAGTDIRGEPQLLRELVGNLIDNAIRYGKQGGQVTLGVRSSPTRVFVEDDGPGIAENERERVLEPFYRVPRSKGSGCGLGLAIAREIAARHGASLKIGYHAPTGTRVEVVFK